MKKGLSGGGVSICCTWLVIDRRENEIRNFKPEEYWTIEGEFQIKNQNSMLNSFIIKINLLKLKTKKYKKLQAALMEINRNYKRD
ncbi:hypothetical protein ACV56Z_04050 [Staphylococcus aureus]